MKSPIKVLLVSHNCASRTAGQPKAHCLAMYPDIALTTLVPDRTCFYGQWETAERPENPAFRFVVGRTRWHYIAKQWYLQDYVSALARTLRETQPDLVNFWQEPWSLVCARGIWLTRRLCPKARIVGETEQNIYKRLLPPFQQFQNYSLRQVDFMVARNGEGVEVLRRKGYNGAARVIPNAVDCQLFRKMPPSERAAQRAALGWGPETFVIGYVGRLVPEKGLNDALLALSQLPSHACLALVGDGIARAELEAHAHALGIADRVWFLEKRPFTELPGLMNALDVLILPSRTTANWKEQFGRVLIEAGACGVAVVGSDSGAIPEVIGESGMVFPEGDAVRLANCLRRLEEDPVRRAHYGQIGYRRAHTQYSWECVAAQMRDIYRTVMDLPIERDDSRQPDSHAVISPMTAD